MTFIKDLIDIPERVQKGDFVLRLSDYLVDEENNLLEVSGRSRRSDFQAAWDARWKRLSDRLESGFFVGIFEFETPAGRLAFASCVERNQKP